MVLPLAFHHRYRFTMKSAKAPSGPPVLSFHEIQVALKPFEDRSP